MGNPGPSQGGNGRGAANGAGGHHKGGGEYMGPVFIVRELNHDEGVYDAFITTGGIQEVKPPQASVKSPAAGQQQQQRPGPSAEEDPEYFGVLVTPETVRQLRIPKSVFVNASLSMLLSAASSKMPWLLVLRRSSYGELMLGGDPQKRPSSPAQQSAPEPAADPTGGMLPGLMQVPQRRRYYNPDVRQRRAADFRFGRPLPDADATRIVPLILERELLSTMCYNFARDNRDYRQLSAMYAPPRDRESGREDARIDVDAYAAAAARFVQSPSEEPEESPQPESAVPMTVPKRVP